jgi:ribose/xylose/arabinose/galactoside ABC-type transport system permease subunit
MSFLESKLRPGKKTTAWRMDLAVTALLAGVCALLLPGWNLGEGSGFTNFQAQMAGAMLLPAMGMVLAMRRGAIDLGVWGVMALGGAVAATLINAGWLPAAAFMAAIGVGAVLGLVNGVCSAWLRVPSPLVTLLVGAGALWATHWLAGGGEAIVIPEFTFETWKANVMDLVQGGPEEERNLHGLPVVLLTRMLFVAGCWAVVMLAMVLVSGWEAGLETPRSRRVGLAVALAASGALASAGGAAWLIDYGSTPVPAALVGDLRIPAAAVLSGALVCGGSGRVMLAGIWLPVALLVATMWRQQTFYFDAGGYELQLAVLTGEVLLAQWAMRRRLSSPARPTLLNVAVAAGLAGLAVFAASGWTFRPTVRGAMQYVSLALAAGACVLLVADVVLKPPARKRARAA